MRSLNIENSRFCFLDHSWQLPASEIRLVRAGDVKSSCKNNEFMKNLKIKTWCWSKFFAKYIKLDSNNRMVLAVIDGWEFQKLLLKITFIVGPPHGGFSAEFLFDFGSFIRVRWKISVADSFSLSKFLIAKPSFQ